MFIFYTLFVLYMGNDYCGLLSKKKWIHGILNGVYGMKCADFFGKHKVREKNTNKCKNLQAG